MSLCVLFYGVEVVKDKIVDQLSILLRVFRFLRKIASELSWTEVKNMK